jgi:hypothetical protein
MTVTTFAPNGTNTHYWWYVYKFKYSCLRVKMEETITVDPVDAVEEEIEAVKHMDRLMAKSQKGHANVAPPGRFIDSNGKGAPSPHQRHTRIHQPNTTVPHNGQPHPKPSPHHFPRTELDQVDACLQGLPVTQVATICHRTCPLEMIELMSSRMGSKVCHSTVGPDHSLRIWQFHNDAFHADANVQVKRYKVEELEREKMLLRSRHTELKPLLHLFQQIFLTGEHSKTSGNKTRYSKHPSPCMWIPNVSLSELENTGGIGGIKTRSQGRQSIKRSNAKNNGLAACQ